MKLPCPFLLGWRFVPTMPVQSHMPVQPGICPQTLLPLVQLQVQRVL